MIHPVGTSALFLLACAPLASCAMATNQPSASANTAPRGEEPPAWARGAVWYQIFPERFRNGTPSNDPNGAGVFLAPWSSDWYSVQPGELEAHLARRGLSKETYKPHKAGALFDVVFNRRYGGDLQGVVQQLDALKSLGVTAIYLNPIFQARSLHKYETSDYRHIDEALANTRASQAIDDDYYRAPRGKDGAPETEDPSTWLWTEADRYFVDVFLPACKARGLRVVLDGVFNHTGTDFWAFQDIQQRGSKSPYASWYQCEFDKRGALKSWTGWPGRAKGDLPEFRQVRGVAGGRDWDQTVEKGDLAPGIKQHILDITRRWMDPNGDGDPSDGIDGWRLDVAGEVGDEFWREWRTLVKSINKDAIIIAEIWDKVAGLGTPVAQGGSVFDTQMNYPFAKAVLGWLSNAGPRHVVSEGTDPVKRVVRSDKVSSSELGARLSLVFSDPHATNMLHQNLFASHDTDRYVNMLWNPGREYDRDCAEQNLDDREKPGDVLHTAYKAGKPPESVYRLSVLGVAIQATYLGSPMIYYGDEVGMWGSDDPTCRKPMQWEDQFGTLGAPAREDERPMAWLRAEYASWLRLRQDGELGSALRLGTVRHVPSGSDDVFAFVRENEGVRVLVVVNRGEIAFDAAGLGADAPRKGDDVVAPVSARWWKLSALP